MFGGKLFDEEGEMPEDQKTTEKDPNKKLAEKIVKELLSRKMIPPEKEPEVFGKLANGTASQEDWRLWIDMPLMKEEASK